MYIYTHTRIYEYTVCTPYSIGARSPDDGAKDVQICRGNDEHEHEHERARGHGKGKEGDRLGCGIRSTITLSRLLRYMLGVLASWRLGITYSELIAQLRQSRYSYFVHTPSVEGVFVACSWRVPQSRTAPRDFMSWHALARLGTKRWITEYVNSHVFAFLIL